MTKPQKATDNLPGSRRAVNKRTSAGQTRKQRASTTEDSSSGSSSSSSRGARRTRRRRRRRSSTDAANDGGQSSKRRRRNSRTSNIRRSRSKNRLPSNAAKRRRSRSRIKGRLETPANMRKRLDEIQERRRSDSNDSESQRDSEDVRDLKMKLVSKIKKGRRKESTHFALKILERNSKIDNPVLLDLLEMAAMKPGAGTFALIADLCVTARIELTVHAWAKIMGLVVSRGAPIAQVRLMLNLVVPRGEPFIPLVPPDLEPGEVDAVFQDEVLEDDSEAEEENDKGNMTREAPPERIEIVGLRLHPYLNGRYEIDLDTTSFGRATYQRADEAKGMIHYKRDDKGGHWVLSFGFSEKPLLINRRETRNPPRVGWQALVGKGRLQADAAVFKTVAIADDGPHLHGQLPDTSEILVQETERLEKAQQEAVESAKKHMGAVDLACLRGCVKHKDVQTLEYFSHFCVLMHLELMAEVSSVRRRRQKMQKEMLVRTGWAAFQLQVRSIFGRRDSNRRMLPGWDDPGTEMIAFLMPRGWDMEKSRFGRGDCVTVSETDPALDKVGEGLVTDIKPNVIVVQLNGRFHDQPGKTWRIDKSANRVVYERQFNALLQIALEDKHPPCTELLVTADVGGVDDWVEAMQHRGGPGPQLKAPGQCTEAEAGGKVSDSRCASRSKSMSISPQPGKKTGRAQSANLPGKRRSDTSKGARNANEKKGAKSKSKKERENPVLKIANLAPKDVEAVKVLEKVDKEVELLTNLNQSQKAAVLKGLVRTCSVIQGPPGTGKTHVSVQVLRIMARTLNGAPLLATSDSNVAVDNIATGLARIGIRVVRLGRPEKVRSELDSVTLEAHMSQEKERQAQEEKEKQDSDDKDGKGKNDNKDRRNAGNSSNQRGDSKERSRSRSVDRDDIGSLRKGGSFDMGRPCGKSANELKGAGKGKFGKKAGDEMDLEAEHAARRKQRQKDMEMQQKILQTAEVVCTTTIASGGEILSKLNFSAILIDEVAQATELSVVVPIVLRGGKAQKRLILVGDHCQLPPGIQSQEAERRGLSLSIYSRFQRAGIEPSFLDTQYRSHPKLAEFSSQAFYNNTLGSGVAKSDRTAPKGIPWPSPDAPVAFVEVGSAEEAEGDSKANTAEAQRVMRLVAQIIAAEELGFEDIGIVTPYVAQVRKLRQLFRQIIPPEFDPRRLEIASVDAFQGREKEIIIFSAVRCNPQGKVGFLGDWRRLNVMLTRARRGLIVFGTASTLRHDPYWEKWLKWCEAAGAVHGGTLRLHNPIAPEPLQQMQDMPVPITSRAGTDARPAAPRGLVRPSAEPLHSSGKNRCKGGVCNSGFKGVQVHDGKGFQKGCMKGIHHSIGAPASKGSCFSTGPAGGPPPPPPPPPGPPPEHMMSSKGFTGNGVEQFGLAPLSGAGYSTAYDSAYNCGYDSAYNYGALTPGQHGYPDTRPAAVSVEAVQISGPCGAQNWNGGQTSGPCGAQDWNGGQTSGPYGAQDWDGGACFAGPGCEAGQHLHHWSEQVGAHQSAFQAHAAVQANAMAAAAQASAHAGFVGGDMVNQQFWQQQVSPPDVALAAQGAEGLLNAQADQAHWLQSVMFAGESANGYGS